MAGDGQLGRDRTMSAYSYQELREHIGHAVVVVEYGNGVNVAIECEDCCEVLLDFDEDEDEDEDEDATEG